MNNQITNLLITAVLCVALAGCSRESRVNYQHDVEIAPNQWITLKEQIGKCWFITEWKGKKVMWPGKTNRDGEAELPVTLREHKGNLYFIVLNREDMEAVKYIYQKLDDSGTRFVEIIPSEFPKSIATENMTALSPRIVSVDNDRVDSWEAIRKLDVEHSYFGRSQTADIWIQLETGLKLELVTGMDYDSRMRIIRDFASKYKPVPLPTLMKEN